MGVPEMRKLITITLAGLTSLAASAASAAEASGPTLKTNEAIIRDAQSGERLKLPDAMTAFRAVFAKLPARVFVFPTENYYYWTLSAGGVTYAGNLRLAAQDRDTGILHFAAFQQANAANPSGPMMYRALSAKEGVAVVKKSTFVYAVTFGDKTVTFQLNDTSAIKPPAEILAPDETHLGTIHDESGLRFYLLFNPKLRVFSYVLVEQGPVLDKLVPIEDGSRIEVGARTGFAFYRHQHRARRVLIGVHGGNTVVNNYFDGPADQLAENHIVDDNLRKAIVAYDPRFEGALDTFGYLNSGEGRYLIAPYIQYTDRAELLGFDACATHPETTTQVYDACFDAGDE